MSNSLLVSTIVHNFKQHYNSLGRELDPIATTKHTYEIGTGNDRSVMVQLSSCKVFTDVSIDTNIGLHSGQKHEYLNHF
jgi:hypothetical protein